MRIRLNMRVTPTDADARWSTLVPKMRAAVRGVIADNQDRILEGLKEAAPKYKDAERRPDMVGREPGENLAAKIRISSIRASGEGVNVYIALPTIARYTLPPGTKPHYIPLTQREGRHKDGLPLLHYFVPGEYDEETFSGERFARQVFHPGYRPSRDWVADAIKPYQRDLAAQLRGSMVTITGEIRKR